MKNTIKKEVGKKMPVIEYLECKKCNYKWLPRLLDKMPVRCPRCKRYDWDKPKKDKTLIENAA